MFATAHRRRLATAAVAAATWILTGAVTAFAKVGPDDPGSTATPPGTDPGSAVDWTQLALMSTGACLIGVAATLAIQFVVRRSHRGLMAHA